MRVERCTCDMCGREFDDFDAQENFGIHYRNVGYGSKFDESHIHIDLCCRCFDKMMENYVIPNLIGDKEQYITDACP